MNWFRFLFQYFVQVRKEMAVVTWPTRSQTLRLTLLVIVVSICIAVLVGLLDFLFGVGFKLLIGK